MGSVSTYKQGLYSQAELVAIVRGSENDPEFLLIDD